MLLFDNMKIFYDVVTKQDIIFEDGKFVSKCREMGLDSTTFSHICGPGGREQLFCYKRYILPENKDKIFTLIEVDTGTEYDCITNTTMEVHLGCKMTENEVKYVYELLRKRQRFASIQGRVFCLKGTEDLRIKSTKTKAKSIKIDAIKKQKRLEYKISSRLRHRIYLAIKANNTKKTSKTEKLLGCSFQYFMGYLSALFKPNMTWENYGSKWHVDHVKSCSSFDLTKEEEQYKCFNYTNLRPLWATTEIAREHGDMESIGNLNREKEFRDSVIV